MGSFRDLPALEARLAGLEPDERRAIDAAIELQRSHLVSYGPLPADPSAIGS